MLQSTGHDEPQLDSSKAPVRPLDSSVLVGQSGAVSVAVFGHTAATVTGKSRDLSSRGRDPRVDTLRGLFLLVMMVDHLPHHALQRFTRQGLGFVSAAEGFVF